MAGFVRGREAKRLGKKWTYLCCFRRFGGVCLNLGRLVIKHFVMVHRS
jgi:hypothetical protein